MTRKYATKKKTTTREGKREYQRKLMADRRARNKKALNHLLRVDPQFYKAIFGSKPKRKKK